MKTALRSTIAALTIYLVGAFITWEVNPANWNEAGRMVMGFLWIAVAGLLVATSARP